MSGAALNRADVPAEQRWNAESVFENVDAARRAVDALRREIAALAEFEGTLARGPERVAAWFDARSDAEVALRRLRSYAAIASSVDTDDREANELRERVGALAGEWASTLAFAEPELLAVGLPRLRRWCEASPALAPYRHAVERLARLAPHVRDAATETLLGSLADPFTTPATAHGLLANRDLDLGEAEGADGERRPISQAAIRSLLQRPDRALRRSAWCGYADAHLRFAPTMAALLSGGAKQTNALAAARRYDDALAMTLEPEALPRRVVDELLTVFEANLGVWHRYWAARRERLGVETLRPWDTFAPLQADPPEVEYERAVGWLCDALRPLGDDYVETMRRGALEERWVDRAPNRGKRMGAFSSGAPGTHPFIVMSWSDDVFGMSTLAHELGHSVHSHATFRAQPAIYSRYSMFVAEVASNFNQAALRAHLWERFEHDERMRLAIVEEAMSNFYRYFFVMPTLMRFELWLHDAARRGEALTAEALNETMAALFAEGYGDEMALDDADRERVGVTWAQFHTHLYSRFYVFQYATGISGAHALAEPVMAGDADAARRYRAFLAAGASAFPLDALRDAGVDLAEREPVETTFRTLERWVERLEALAG